MKEDYFKTIDTAEKAYLLGFLFADGSIRGNRVLLNLAQKDEVIIDKFISCIQGGTKVPRLIKGKYQAIYLTIGSKELCSDLRNLGFVGMKYDRMNLPILEKEFYDPFLLGYYDGDGSEVGSVLASGNFQFLNNIKILFNIPFEIRLKTNPKGECYIFSIGTDLKRRITSSYPFSMERKREIKYTKKEDGFDTKVKIAKYSNSSRTKKSKPRCIKCDREINFNSKYCQPCYQEIKSELRSKDTYFRKVKDRPSLFQLEDDLKNSNYLAVGRKYGVSDNAIRKWIRGYLKDGFVPKEENFFKKMAA